MQRKILQTVALVTIALLLYGNIFIIYSRSFAATASDNNPEQTAGTALSSTISISQSSQSLTISSCNTPSPYSPPSDINLLNRPSGLSVQIDEPYTYVVRANTVKGLRNAIALCPYRAAIAGRYHAMTAREINWGYIPTFVENKCVLADVRVGLHITQFLPSLDPDSNLSQEDMAAWNLYESNLKTHEDGHVTTAKRYTESLVSSLRNMSAPTCDQLKVQADLTISSSLADLNNADADYDASTNHGATQGAVL